jgi:hypothetical protein
MEIFGPAIGMVGGLAILVIVLWKFPEVRQSSTTPNLIENTIFLIMMVALIGGWIGYWIVATLFHG